MTHWIIQLMPQVPPAIMSTFLFGRTDSQAILTSDREKAAQFKTREEAQQYITLMKPPRGFDHCAWGGVEVNKPAPEETVH